MDPTPFTINVSEDELADLRRKLANTRWPDQVPGGGWTYGTDLEYLKALVDYWRDRYDWRAHESMLNAFPQFTVPLGGIDQGHRLFLLALLLPSARRLVRPSRTAGRDADRLCALPP